MNKKKQNDKFIFNLFYFNILKMKKNIIYKKEKSE